MSLREILPDTKTSGVAAAAHELKNPMEAMTNLLYLLQQNPTLDDAGLRYVALMRNELERMRIVVSHTLGLYRESARQEAVQVSDVLDEIVDFYANKIRYKEIAVQKKYQCAEVIKAVPGEIRQVLTNLVVNALEAVPRKGKVTLHTRAGRDWRKPSSGWGVRVIVADSGSGIRPEHRSKLYVPFFTTKGDKGNGLGLWLSRDIVEQYGGSIRVRSSIQPDKSGTTFSVFLPAEELKSKNGKL